MRLRMTLALCMATAGPVAAEPVANPIALFSGLDKITAITTAFQDKVGEDVVFGALTIKASTCLTRPITEAPNTVAFVEIDASQPDGSRKHVFSGWMFAESPGLNGLEHPVYDVWLTGCFDPAAPPPPVEAAPAEKPEQPEPAKDQPED